MSDYRGTYQLAQGTITVTPTTDANRYEMTQSNGKTYPISGRQIERNISLGYWRPENVEGVLPRAEKEETLGGQPARQIDAATAALRPSSEMTTAPRDLQNADVDRAGSPTNLKNSGMGTSNQGMIHYCPMCGAQWPPVLATVIPAALISALLFPRGHILLLPLPQVSNRRILSRPLHGMRPAECRQVAHSCWWESSLLRPESKRGCLRRLLPVKLR